MADNDKKVGQPASPAGRPAAGAPKAATVGGVVVTPEAAGVTVSPKDAGKDPIEVKKGVALGLDQIAKNMAAGAGQTPETREAIAAELDGLAEKAEEDGAPVDSLSGLADKLREKGPGEDYKTDEKAAAHGKLVQAVAEARDKLNESIAKEAAKD